MAKIRDACALILSANMKTLRGQKGWTQAEFAEHAKLSLSAIRHFENNTRWPRPENITAMAKALDVHCSQLFLDSSLTFKPTVMEALEALNEALGMEKKRTIDKHMRLPYSLVYQTHTSP